jgi:uncharacterized protein
MSSDSKPAAKPCPICGQPRLQQFQPFCSRRCADVDLNRWFKGVYSVPVVEEDGSLDEGEPGGPGER